MAISIGIAVFGTFFVSDEFLGIMFFATGTYFVFMSIWVDYFTTKKDKID
jgi:hypothetical protein